MVGRRPTPPSSSATSTSAPVGRGATSPASPTAPSSAGTAPTSTSTLPTRLVSTEMFEGYPDAEPRNTLRLTERDGTTVLTVTVLHSSQEHRDGHVASGMEAGCSAPSTGSRTSSPQLQGRVATSASPSATGGWRPASPPRQRGARPTRGTTRRLRGLGRARRRAPPGRVDPRLPRRRRRAALPAGPSVDDDPAGAWTALGRRRPGAPRRPRRVGHRTISHPTPAPPPRRRRSPRSSSATSSCTRGTSPGPPGPTRPSTPSRARHARRHGAPRRDAARQRPVRPAGRGAGRRRRADPADRLHRPPALIDSGPLDRRLRCGVRSERSGGSRWSILVVLELEAVPGSEATMIDVLRRNLGDTRARQGCEGVTVHQDQDRPTSIVLVERWATRADDGVYNGPGAPARAPSRRWPASWPDRRRSATTTTSTPESPGISAEVTVSGARRRKACPSIPSSMRAATSRDRADFARFSAIDVEEGAFGPQPLGSSSLASLASPPRRGGRTGTGGSLSTLRPM